MKRSDIKVGESYQVQGDAQAVVVRVISKHLFGFRIRCEWSRQWDVGYPIYKVIGSKWSWKFAKKVVNKFKTI